MVLSSPLRFHRSTGKPPSFRSQTPQHADTFRTRPGSLPVSARGSGTVNNGHAVARRCISFILVDQSMQATSSSAPILPVPVPPVLRSLIDQTINAILEEAASSSGLEAGPIGRCGDYAIVGARVLTLLTRHPYVAVSGGELIDCG